MIVKGEKEVIAALLAAGHEPAVRRFEKETATASSSAEALGVETDRIVKSLVFSAEGNPVVALVPGNRRADLKAVAATLGLKKVRLADPDAVKEWTGFVVGAVPPIGHSQPIPLLMDTNIPSEGKIYPAAGEINNAFETTFELLKNITGAKLCRISQE